eukprot:CAMPEP_0113821154 /NCGR_PEP_ID=MMETSP0328-20130328/1596_1 /TAXON_ID=39455 /ORGANISM="Alexandrium minutum" /LENGTH=220 /DNA_ID=CAMNT_0000789085 /DNA_START=88 /DNA_END=748 /DNA_ORIENTATION=- /assembly_acc=CAM_ASM_000350
MGAPAAGKPGLDMQILSDQEDGVLLPQSDVSKPSGRLLHSVAKLVAVIAMASMVVVAAAGLSRRSNTLRGLEATAVVQKDANRTLKCYTEGFMTVDVVDGLVCTTYVTSGYFYRNVIPQESCDIMKNMHGYYSQVVCCTTNLCNDAEDNTTLKCLQGMDNETTVMTWQKSEGICSRYKVKLTGETYFALMPTQEACDEMKQSADNAEVECCATDLCNQLK